MNPVAKALWFIESHFASDVTLAQIADVAGVSRYHLVRAFGVTTGCSVMRYVRRRRLSEAARTLANGAPDILMVALDAGYGSHEAFSRAFRDQFGLTPDMARARRTVVNLSMLEPFAMDETIMQNPQPPRIEDANALLIAGLSERFAFEDTAGIPALWQRFNEHQGQVPGQTGPVAYGACHNTDEAGGFDYIAGGGGQRLRCPARRICPAPCACTTLCGVHARRSRLGHPRDVHGDLQRLVAKVRISAGGCTGVGTLRRALRRTHRHGRVRDMDSSQSVVTAVKIARRASFMPALPVCNGTSYRRRRRRHQRSGHPGCSACCHTAPNASKGGGNQQ